MPQSICIIRLSALGDVLMLVPLIRTLQTAFPNAKLTWIITRPAYDLVAGMEGIEFIVIEKPKGLRDYLQFKKQMRGRFFDVLLATQASLRANLLVPLIRARRKIGYDRHRAKDGHRWFVRESIAPGEEHTLEGFLKFAEVLGVKKRDVRWDLPLSTQDMAWAKQHIPAHEGPIVLVNPAASKPERTWSVERYIAVIQHLKDKWRAKIVLTGGPTAFDKKLAEQIKSSGLIDKDLVGKTKPKQLLALISLGDLMLCPDTGPAHMAGAVGTPVVALHAVTNPKISGPYPFRHLVVDCYPEAIQKFLQKDLKSAPWGTQVHGTQTMALVTIDKVTQQVDNVLKELKKSFPNP